MADMLDRLPGGIPGLPGPGGRVRVTTPGRYQGDVGTVVCAYDHSIVVLLDRADDGGCLTFGPEELTILLTDSREARVHAAWWWEANRDPDGDYRWDFLAAVDVARFGRDMTPTQIDTLARAVLAVAGREAG